VDSESDLEEPIRKKKGKRSKSSSKSEKSSKKRRSARANSSDEEDGGRQGISKRESEAFLDSDDEEAHIQVAYTFVAWPALGMTIYHRCRPEM
jgi:hypothetical protein